MAAYYADIPSLLMRETDSLDIPVLAVWGAFDPFIPISLRQHGATTTNVLLPAGHWPHLTNRRRFTRALRRFLEE